MWWSPPHLYLRKSSLSGMLFLHPTMLLTCCYLTFVIVKCFLLAFHNFLCVAGIKFKWGYNFEKQRNWQFQHVICCLGVIFNSIKHPLLFILTFCTVFQFVHIIKYNALNIQYDWWGTIQIRTSYHKCFYYKEYRSTGYLESIFYNFSCLRL